MAGLDIEEPVGLLKYLLAHGYVQSASGLHTRRLPGGVSSRVVLVTLPSGEAWVLKQALSTLRVAVTWHSSPERTQREAIALRWLAAWAPPGTIPGLVFADPAENLLAMQAVPEPHENWKSILLVGRVEAGLVEQFARLLAVIHRNSHAQAEVVSQVFGDQSFFESLRLEPYYEYTADRVPQAAAFLRQLLQATRAHQLTLVHGDYSPKNVLVRAGRLVLLDHEVAHYGDPAFDLGFSLTHLLSKAHHLPAQQAAFAAAAKRYWQSYLEAVDGGEWVRALEPRVVRSTLGCLLARVAGRSPLEYLSREERDRQQQVVVRLMRDTPDSVAALTDHFLRGVQCQ